MIRGLRFTTKGGPGSGNIGHAGRPGQVGGSAPGINFIVMESITRQGIPLKHIEGLNIKSITDDTTYPWIDLIDRFYNVETRQRTSGLFVPETKTIYIDPKTIRGPKSALDQLVTHEVGHYVAEFLLSIGRPTLLSIQNNILPDLKKSKSLAKTYGLRKYSLTNSYEFLADAYKVKIRGSKDQWNKLNTLILKTTGQDLDMLYKEAESL